MSSTDPTFAPVSPDRDSTPAPTGADSAKQRAADVKDTSVEAGQHVAGVAKDELGRVGSETKRQAKDLYRETRTELADQAAAQQQRVASGIRSLGDEFDAMSASSETQGVASDLAQQASARAGKIADWLEQRDPGALLEEVKGFARRSPGTFIAVAAVAGVLAGRLTRSVIAESKESSEGSDSGQTGMSTSTGRVAGVGSDTGAGAGLPGERPFTATAAPTPPNAPVGDPLLGQNPDFGGTPR
jgi:hypothetical protein